MKKDKIKFVLLKLLYIAFLYLFNKLTKAIRLSLRGNVMSTILAMGEGFSKAFDTFAPSFHPVDLTVAVIGTGTVNRDAKKATRYYIDEMHLLLKEEQTAAYTVEIWKRFRKWGGIPSGLTQNVKDLLASKEVENIFENSDFVLMLNQAAGDRAILAKQLNISTRQMKYVTGADAGEGLIFYGNVILPFVDRFPKDTELYRVMTTKPEEVGEKRYE